MAQMRPERSMEVERGPEMAKDGSRTPLGGGEDGPRWPQDGAKTAQDSPRGGQDRPKTSQDGPKTGPRSTILRPRWPSGRQDEAEEAEKRKWPKPKGKLKFLVGPRPVGKPKMGPRRPEDGPRWAQDGRRWRRWAKDLRKFAQEAASERQDAVSEGRESGFEAEKARGISVEVRLRVQKARRGGLL